MRKLFVITSLAVLSAAAAAAQSSSAAKAAPKTATPTVASQHAVLEQYCFTCHNQKVKIGGIALDKLDLTKVSQDTEVWEKVVRKLRAGMMPPVGSRRPEPAAYETLTASIENEIDRAAVTKPFLQPPGVHRVNRTEYANTVRDLLGISVDPAQYLPVDDSSGGFDNVAGTLAISPALAEGYLSAAAKISKIALGHDTSPDQKRYIAPSDLSQENHVQGLPFGTRGGMMIDHYFPADGDYSLYWSPVRGINGDIFGSNRKGEQVEVIVDGARVKLFDFEKVPEGCGDCGEQKATTEAHVTLKAGTHRVGVTFLSKTEIPIYDLNQHSLRSVLDTVPIPGYIFAPQIAQLTVEGPFKGERPKDTPSRKTILICTPANAADEVPCAKKIISNLARQAFRRPVADSDMEDFLTLFQSGRNDGNFEDGIERVVQGILSHAEFVFRGEADPATAKPGQPYRISDLELASRLSFFLWSTAPDEQLMTLATQNKLHEPKTLEAQVHRMLADSRSHALVTNFAGQWLQLRNLASAAPITQLFPDFDDNLRQAFRTETEMFFESIMREDRSVMDLLTANYTFVNERLARHYDIPNIYGSQFRRIELGPEFDMRRGLLGQGAIQLVTAVADRTSPVERGKWVLLNILGTVPPDPPPNVPALRTSNKTANGQAVPLELSMRERMQEHRANPVCAACHQKMDPIGFSMETFDAVGKYRTTEFGKKLDLSANLTDGIKFDGVAGLREALLKYKPQFVRSITEKLMVYALGRNVEYGDMPVVRAISREAAQNNNKFTSLVMGVVKSAPFQMNLKQSDTVARLDAVNSGR